MIRPRLGRASTLLMPGRTYTNDLAEHIWQQALRMDLASGWWDHCATKLDNENRRTNERFEARRLAMLADRVEAGER